MACECDQSPATPLKLQTHTLFLLTALAVGKIEAHETWLAPSEFAASVGSEIQFSLTSGMNFPKLEYAIKPERISICRCRQGKTNLPLQFREKFPKAGLLTAWVVLFPKTLELSEKEVAEYFEEIAAPAEMRAFWNRLKAHHQWRETYTKCAKTFVAVGHASADSSWQEPVGMPLEIIPLNDPTKLRAGENFSVELRENGKPVAHASVGLIANRKRIFQQTDEAGRATFVLEKEGPALFFAVQLEWREGNWFSIFSTLCLEAI